MGNIKLRKGSLTVEAACVIPLIILVLMGILYLCFFVHNRAWLTAAGYEAAVAGSMEGIKEDGKVYETARMRSEELGNVGFFGAENLSVQINAGAHVQVTYHADIVSEYGGFSWPLRAEGKAEVICPVKWIRKAKAAVEIFTGTGE